DPLAAVLRLEIGVDWRDLGRDLADQLKSGSGEREANAAAVNGIARTVDQLALLQRPDDAGEAGCQNAGALGNLGRVQWAFLAEHADDAPLLLGPVVSRQDRA